MAFGYVARIPFAEHIMFSLVTIAAIVQALRRSTPSSSLPCNISVIAFFGLASFAYMSTKQLLPGAGYALMSVIWLGLTIYAAMVRHRLEKESSATLARAVNSTRRAMENDE
ncbi:MAG: hypothetical protein P8J37_24300 [Fuerstiella sp.]|nr:hypothetical protein [Fuerstiella sp.]